MASDLLPWVRWLMPGERVRHIATGDPDCDDLDPWTVTSIGYISGEQEVVLTRPGEAARWPLVVALEILEPAADPHTVAVLLLAADLYQSAERER